MKEIAKEINDKIYEMTDEMRKDIADLGWEEIREDVELVLGWKDNKEEVPWFYYGVLFGFGVPVSGVYSDESLLCLEFMASFHFIQYSVAFALVDIIQRN